MHRPGHILSDVLIRRRHVSCIPQSLRARGPACNSIQMCRLSSPCACASTRTCMPATLTPHVCVPYTARTSYVSTHESHCTPGRNKSDDAMTGGPMRQKPTAMTPMHGLCDIPYWTETGACTYKHVWMDPLHEHVYAHDIPCTAAYHAYTHAYTICLHITCAAMQTCMPIHQQSWATWVCTADTHACL